MNWLIWLKELKRLWNLIKGFTKIKNLEKGKRPKEQSSKEKGKGSFKGKKVECFNYGGLAHFATNCPIFKDIEKSM